MFTGRELHSSQESDETLQRNHSRYCDRCFFCCGFPVQDVDVPFRRLGFDYEQQYPCTLIVMSNQPSENQVDLGVGLSPPNFQGLVRYPAQCVNEYKGNSESMPTNLEVDCTNRRMGSSSWSGIYVFL